MFLRPLSCVKEGSGSSVPLDVLSGEGGTKEDIDQPTAWWLEPASPDGWHFTGGGERRTAAVLICL